MNSRTYWYRSQAGGPNPVEWACRLLERLRKSMSLPHVFTVVEPPSDAYWLAFLDHPFDPSAQEVSECGHLGEPFTPNGRFYDEALDPEHITPDSDSPWGPFPHDEIDEFGERRSSWAHHESKIWLVGGAWTHADANNIESGAYVDGPFYVFGPDSTIRPPHPWDPEGNLP